MEEQCINDIMGTSSSSSNDGLSMTTTTTLEESAAGSVLLDDCEDEEKGTINNTTIQKEQNFHEKTSDNHLYDLVDKQRWDQVRTFLAPGAVSDGVMARNMQYRKSEWFGSNPLLRACSNIAPLDVIIELLNKYDNGANGELSAATDIDGYTCLHWGCEYNASDEVIKCLCEYGGKDLLLAKDDRGETALHVACRNGKSLDVVECMCKYGGYELVIMENSSGKSALYHAASNLTTDTQDVLKFLFDFSGYVSEFGEGPCDALVSVFLQISRRNFDPAKNKETHVVHKDPIGDFLLNDKPIQHDVILRFQSLWLNLDPFTRSATLKSFNRTLRSVQVLKPEDRDLVLEGSFIKAALNHKIIEVPTLFVLFVDFITQLFVILTLTILIDAGEKMSYWAVINLALTWAWTAVRETSQIATSSSFWEYVGEPSNWFDILQLGIIPIFFIGSRTSNVDQNMLIAGIAISFVRMIFISGNMVYSVAVFVSALIAIFREIMGFLYVTVIIVIAFAHMFYVANVSTPNNSITCKQWTCSLSNSYRHSFAMLLGEDPDFFLDSSFGINSTLAICFGFIIGVLLLNIIIALVSDVFSSIRHDSEKAFWERRLRFVNEIDSMGIIGRMKKYFPGLDYVLDFLHGLNDTGFHALPERRILSRKDPRGYDEWNNKDDSFIDWFIGGEGKRSFDLFERLGFFIQAAEWKEIIPPSGAFRKIVIHKNQNEKLSFCENFVAIVISCIFFLLSVALLPVILVLGFLSFGYFWPRELKRFLFFVDVKKSCSSDILHGNMKKLRAEMDNKGEEIDGIIRQLKQDFNDVNNSTEQKLNSILKLLQDRNFPRERDGQNKFIRQRSPVN